MRTKITALLTITALWGLAAYAGADRVIDAHIINDTGFHLTMPAPGPSALPDVLVSRESSDTLKNKTLSGADNTFSNIPTSAIASSALSGSNSGDVTLGTANGLSLIGQALSLGTASSSTTGALSSTDWSTFNGKQSALGFTPLDAANLDTNISLSTNSDSKIASQKAVKAYADSDGGETQVSLSGTAYYVVRTAHKIFAQVTANTDVMLPDATTLRVGENWLIYNSSSLYTLTIKRSNGATLSTSGPGESRMVVVEDNSNAVGTWRYKLQYIPFFASANTANAAVIRDANARAQFSDPSAAQDAATKNYVDTNFLLSSSFSDSAVTGKLLTGFTSGAGTISGTDSILGAIQKLDGNIGALSSPIVAGTTNHAISVWDSTTSKWIQDPNGLLFDSGSFYYSGSTGQNLGLYAGDNTDAAAGNLEIGAGTGQGTGNGGDTIIYGGPAFGSGTSGQVIIKGSQLQVRQYASATDIKISGVATPTSDNHAANKKYVDDAIAGVGSSAPSIGGSTGSPQAVTAGAGINIISITWTNVAFVAGSGGPVDITASPQVAAGTSVGQKLTVIGTSDTNTLKLDDGTGLSLNGSMVLGNHSVIDLIWDGSVWVEESRR
jgi:hypothetical protein